MKDGQGSLVRGRTRWRRFAVAFIPAGALAGILMAGVAQGAVPVAINVSGQTFKVSASKLVGNGFSQYGSVVVDAKGNQIPVTVSAIRSATLYDLCQSVTVPGSPITLLITAGGNNNPATATNMVIGMNHLVGTASFTNIDIGQDASTLTKGGDSGGLQGTFGQQADSVTITNLEQTAYSTHAGTFTLNGLDMRLSLSGQQCFPDLP